MLAGRLPGQGRGEAGRSCFTWDGYGTAALLCTAGTGDPPWPTSYSPSRPSSSPSHRRRELLVCGWEGLDGGLPGEEELDQESARSQP